MKKSCIGCRALRLRGKNINGFNESIGYCELGYKINEVEKKPLEPCPKPKTYNQLFTEKKLK